MGTGPDDTDQSQASAGTGPDDTDQSQASAGTGPDDTDQSQASDCEWNYEMSGANRTPKIGDAKRNKQSSPGMISLEKFHH